MEVKRLASTTDIKKAFRSFALLYHPDKTNNDKAKMERFKNIRAAYEVLGDPISRRVYDATLPPEPVIQVRTDVVESVVDDPSNVMQQDGEEEIVWQSPTHCPGRSFDWTTRDGCMRVAEVPLEAWLKEGFVKKKRKKKRRSAMKSECRQDWHDFDF